MEDKVKTELKLRIRQFLNYYDTIEIELRNTLFQNNHLLTFHIEQINKSLNLDNSLTLHYLLESFIYLENNLLYDNLKTENYNFRGIYLILSEIIRLIRLLLKLN